MSIFKRLKKGLSKSRDGLAAMFPGQSKDKLSDAEWQDIEDALIMADCGAQLAMDLIAQAKKTPQPLQSLRLKKITYIAVIFTLTFCFR